MKRFDFAYPFLVLVIAACRGNPSPNPAPTAAFTVSGAQQAGLPVRFAATGSAGSGGGLTYSWGFGDATSGGTREIAHLYAQAGAYPVQLTVRDAAGRTASASRTVTVSAGPAASGAATVDGRVTLTDGTPLPAVVVGVAGSGGTVSSGPDGRFTLASVPVGVPAVVHLSRAGHLPGVVRLELAPGTTHGYVEAVLVPRRAAVTLAASEAGGTAAGPDGARVQVPAGALVDAAGNPVTGAVEVEITPLDLRTQAAAFPGAFAGVQPDGQTTAIASLGVTDVTLTRGGAPVRVAPGRTVTVELPIYVGSASVGQTVPLWSLSEAAGVWVQEGAGTVVASAGSPTGLALRGEVAHFSPWNVDIPFVPGYSRPRCVEKHPDLSITPLAGPCWVGTAPAAPGAGWVGSGASIMPPPSTTLAAYPNTPQKAVGVAIGDLRGESAPFTVASGAVVDVDVVLTLAPSGPVNLVGAGGGLTTLSISTDGSTWLPSPPPAGWSGNWMRGVASSGAQWVVVGTGTPPIVTSPGGQAWTAAQGAPFTEGRDVAWNGTSWMSVGPVVTGGNTPVGAAVATSPDGVQWSGAATLANFDPAAVASNGSLWMVGGTGVAGQPHAIFTSPDGTTWTPRPSPFTSGVRALAWNGAMWVAGGLGGGVTLATSTDQGVTWIPRTAPLSVAALGWNGSLWVAGGFSQQGSIATSPDGVTWTLRNAQMALVLGIAWTGTQWVAVGDCGLLTSPDGFTWTAVPNAACRSDVAAKVPVFPPLP